MCTVINIRLIHHCVCVLQAHVTMMLFGVLCGLAGLGLILGHTGGSFTVGYHQMVGVVCLSLSVVQPLLGIVRPAVGPTLRWVCGCASHLLIILPFFQFRRKLFNVFHRVMALLILNLGGQLVHPPSHTHTHTHTHYPPTHTHTVAALLLGIYIFHSVQMIWMLAALGLSVVTNMGFMLLLELLTRTQKCETYNLLKKKIKQKFLTNWPPSTQSRLIAFLTIDNYGVTVYSRWWATKTRGSVHSYPHKELYLTQGTVPHTRNCTSDNHTHAQRGFSSWLVHRPIVWLASVQAYSVVSGWLTFLK